MDKCGEKTEHDQREEKLVVLLCPDQNERLLRKMQDDGGCIVGWVDGKYRVLMKKGA